NFLLGCINCNSTKGDTFETAEGRLVLEGCLLPDRDNTFFAYEYFADGRVEPNGVLTDESKALARATLTLTGLDKTSRETRDENGKLIALDRMSQRMEVWGIAEDSLEDYLRCPAPQMQQQVLRTAKAEGFFSIWMKAFERRPEMRSLFVAGFAGTAQDCFD